MALISFTDIMEIIEGKEALRLDGYVIKRTVVNDTSIYKCILFFYFLQHVSINMPAVNLQMIDSNNDDDFRNEPD